MEHRIIIMCVVIWMIGLYFIIASLLQTIIEEQLHIHYTTIKASRMYSKSELYFIERYEKYITFLGRCLFPLYWCFILGTIFGNKLYDILINDNDENRIASWVF